MSDDWQLEAHRLFRLYIRGEFQAVEDHLEAILDDLESYGPMDPKQLVLFREHLLMFERTLTKQLEEIGQLEPDSNLEQIERQGRTVHQKLHDVAYRHHHGSVTKESIESVQEALVEAMDTVNGH